MPDEINLTPSAIPGISRVDPPEIKRADPQEVLEALFDSLITKGFVTKEVKLGDITFVLKPLSTGEFLEAETVYIATVNAVPNDVVGKVRMISSLSHAIISVNGVSIENSDVNIERANRDKLHNLLMKLPPSAIDYLQEAFRAVTAEQEKMFSDLSGKIENF